MLRQYDAPRHRLIPLGGKLRRVGTIPIGTITAWQGAAIIVEAWLPRDYALRGLDGRFRTVRMVGGHLAEVRRLADGRRFQLADHWLRAALDADDVA